MYRRYISYRIIDTIHETTRYGARPSRGRTLAGALSSPMTPALLRLSPPMFGSRAMVSRHATTQHRNPPRTRVQAPWVTRTWLSPTSVSQVSGTCVHSIYICVCVRACVRACVSVCLHECVLACYKCVFV